MLILLYRNILNEDLRQTSCKQIKWSNWNFEIIRHLATFIICKYNIHRTSHYQNKRTTLIAVYSLECLPRLYVTRSDKTGLIAEKIIVQYAYNKFWGKLRLAHLHEDIFLPRRLAKFERYSTLQG